MAVPDDLELRIQVLDPSDRRVVLFLAGAEHVEGAAGHFRLARDDMEQVGGGNALRQRKPGLQLRGRHQRLAVGIDQIGGAEQAFGLRLGRAARQHLAIGRRQIQRAADAMTRIGRLDHEIGGGFQVERGHAKAADGDPWHLGGRGPTVQIDAALKHIVCLAGAFGLRG